MRFDATLSPYRIQYRSYCNVKRRWESLVLSYTNYQYAIEDYEFLTERREVAYALLFKDTQMEPVAIHFRKTPITTRVKIGARKLVYRVLSVFNRDQLTTIEG